VAAAEANYAHALKEAQNNLTKLQRWFNETKAAGDDKVQEIVSEIQKHSEELDDTERGTLQAKYQSGVNKLSELASRSQPSSLDEIKSELQSAKDAADSALEASKGLAKLEKRKMKAMMKEYRTRRSEEKKKARYMQKAVQKAAHEAFRVARKVESAGRKAGQKEHQYEGDLGRAEKVTEKLSGQGEKFGEGGEGHVEKFFEKVEDKLEDARDQVEHQARSEAEQRENRVHELEKEVSEAAEAAARKASAPTASQQPVMMDTGTLRGKPVQSEDGLPDLFLLVAGLACVGWLAAIVAWVRGRQASIETPALALG